VLREQYLDFLRNRRFRRSLLCHADVVVDRTPRPAVIEGLFVASAARPAVEAPDIASPDAVVEFRGPRGSGISTDHRLAKAAMLHLGTMWPRSVALPELAREARAILDEGAGPVARASGEAASDVRVLCDILLSAYAAGVVELGTTAPGFTLEVSEHPTVSPIARLQAERGDEFVSSLRHGSLRIEDAVARQMLCLLDGTRDRAALLREMRAFQERHDGRPPSAVDDPAEPPAVIVSADALERKLSELARLALMVG